MLLLSSQIYGRGNFFVSWISLLCCMHGLDTHLTIPIFKVPTSVTYGDVFFEEPCGWSGGAKVLGKLSVPGRPTKKLD